MTAGVDVGDSLRTSLRDRWRRQPLAYRVCYLIAAVLVAGGVVHLAIAVGSDRPWAGPLSWRKPATFGLSFGVTLASVTWVVSLLGRATRARVTLLAVLAADCVLEVAGITVQAWRHVPSHFNKETGFDAAVANALAAGGGILLIVLGALAVDAWRASSGLRPGLRLGIRSGFGLLLAGLVSGVAMIARGVSLVGQGRNDGRWGDPAYAEAGFVKDFHGVTLHAVLVLPALAMLLSRVRLTEQHRTAVMTAGVGLYVAAAVAVLVWQVAGG